MDEDAVKFTIDNQALQTSLENKKTELSIIEKNTGAITVDIDEANKVITNIQSKINTLIAAIDDDNIETINEQPEIINEEKKQEINKTTEKKKQEINKTIEEKKEKKNDLTKQNEEYNNATELLNTYKNAVEKITNEHEYCKKVKILKEQYDNLNTSLTEFAKSIGMEETTQFGFNIQFNTIGDLIQNNYDESKLAFDTFVEDLKKIQVKINAEYQTLTNNPHKEIQYVFDDLVKQKTVAHTYKQIVENTKKDLIDLSLLIKNEIKHLFKENEITGLAKYENDWTEKVKNFDNAYKVNRQAVYSNDKDYYLHKFNDIIKKKHEQASKELTDFINVVDKDVKLTELEYPTVDSVDTLLENEENLNNVIDTLNNISGKKNNEDIKTLETKYGKKGRFWGQEKSESDRNTDNDNSARKIIADYKTIMGTFPRPDEMPTVLNDENVKSLLSRLYTSSIVNKSGAIPKMLTIQEEIKKIDKNWFSKEVIESDTESIKSIKSAQTAAVGKINEYIKKVNELVSGYITTKFGYDNANLRGDDTNIPALTELHIHDIDGITQLKDAAKLSAAGGKKPKDYTNEIIKRGITSINEAMTNANKQESEAKEQASESKEQAEASQGDQDAQIAQAGKYINKNWKTFGNPPELKNLNELHKITDTLSKQDGAFDLLAGDILNKFNEIIKKIVQNNDPNTSQMQRTENEKKIKELYRTLKDYFDKNKIMENIRKLQDKLTNNKIQIDNNDNRKEIINTVDSLSKNIEQMYTDILYKRVGAVGKPSSSEGKSSSSKGKSSSSRSGPSSSTVSSIASAFMFGGHHKTQKGRKGEISQRGRTQKRKKHT